MSEKIQPNLRNSESGFSLVELSIVLVIIGFLIAGIASGTSMIKQAELRSVVDDFFSYTTAYNVFTNRYNKIPGDMNSAFAYFNTDCADDQKECNGNNNGIIDYESGNNEVNKAWKHLQVAGMINAGIQKLVDSAETRIGLNAPISKVSGAGYIMIGGDDAKPFSKERNVIFIGREKSGNTLINGALSPSDAFYIDQKMDDGWIDEEGNFAGAQTGTIRALDGDDVNAYYCIKPGTGGDTSGGTSGTQSVGDVGNPNAYYNMTTTASVCRLGLALN